MQRLLSETEIGKTQLSRALRSLERKGLVHLYSHLFLGRRRYAADGSRGSYIMMQPRDPQFGNVKAAELRAEGKAVAIKVRQAALSETHSQTGSYHSTFAVALRAS